MNVPPNNNQQVNADAEQQNQNRPPPNDGGAGGDGNHNEVHANNAVRLPIPHIVRDNIELWFIQLDHWFAVNRITSDSTRYSTVVASLDAALLQQIYETVRNPPAAGKYEAIKSAVIRNFSESEQRRAQQFVSGLQLGDKKPSHLLNELRRIGGEAQDEKLLKVLWMNRLPIQVQTCLAAVSEPLNTLAPLADSVMETFRVGSDGQSFAVNAGAFTSSNVAAASTSNPATKNAAKSSDSELLSKLAAQVANLTKQLGKLLNEKSQRGRSASRSSVPSRARSATPAASNGESTEGDGRCWYHRTYGSEATKCREPCTESKN